MTCHSMNRSNFATPSSDIVDLLDQPFEFLGIPNVAKRFQNICITSSGVTKSIERLERARILNLEDGANSRFLLQADGHIDMAVRQVQSLKYLIDEGMRGDGYKKALIIVNSSDPRQGNPDQLLNLISEGIKDQLLESQFSPNECARIHNTVSNMIEACRGGLEPAMAQVVHSMSMFEQQLKNGLLARKETLASRKNGVIVESVAGYIACTAAATAVFIASSIACGYIPYCWCCIFPFLLAGFLAWISACESIPRD